MKLIKVRFLTIVATREEWPTSTWPMKEKLTCLSLSEVSGALHALKDREFLDT